MKNLIEQILWRMIKTRLFSPIRHRIIHTQPFLMRGKTKANFNLSILVFAKYENFANYIAKLAYSAEPEIVRLEKVAYHKISSTIAYAHPEVIVAESDDSLIKFFSKNNFLILPRINFSLDLSPSLEDIIAGMMRLRRRSIRKFQELPYAYELTKNLDKFKFFYDKMYLPFTSRTAKADFARITPISIAEQWFIKGELLLVKSGSTYLSGLVYHPENNALHCRLIAYTDGMAGQAALYHVIGMAKEKGYTEVNYGETSPFMSDGLFFYKKSWGMRMKPKLKNSMVLALKFCNFETPVQNFLKDNPFIFTDFHSLIGLVIWDSENINMHSIYHKFNTPGLHKLVILYPEKNKDAYKILAPYSCPAPNLSSIQSLIKFISKTNFKICTIDFFKFLRKGDTANISHTLGTTCRKEEN